MPKLEQLLNVQERFMRPSIELGLSPVHRYGVFATKDIAPKEIIEECPVIVFRALTLEYRKEIYDRTFFWNDADNAIALGYGSLYNHSYESNATYSVDRNNQLLKFIATKPILAGTEILINYGEEWFACHNARVNAREEQRKNDWGVFKVSILLLGLLALFQIFPINSSTDVESQSPKIIVV